MAGPHCTRCGRTMPEAPAPAAPASAAPTATAPAPGGPAPGPGVKPEWDDAPPDNPVAAKLQALVDYSQFSFDGRGCVYGPMNLVYDAERNLCIAKSQWRKKEPGAGRQAYRPMPASVSPAAGKFTPPLTQGFACSTWTSWATCYWLHINDRWANYIGTSTSAVINPAKKHKKHERLKKSLYNEDIASYFTPLLKGTRKPFTYWLQNDRWKEGFGEFNIGLHRGHVITLWRLGGRLKIRDRANNNEFYPDGLYKLAADGSFGTGSTPRDFSCNKMKWVRIDTGTTDKVGKRYSQPDSYYNKSSKRHLSIWVCRALKADGQPDGGAYANNPLPKLRFWYLEHIEGVPSMADARASRMLKE